MKKEKSILTEVFSMRISKEEKRMLKDLRELYYFDIFRFMRNAIRTEYFSKLNENKK